MATYNYYTNRFLCGREADKLYFYACRTRYSGRRALPKPLNKRSRGRHEPGDGDYVNRWVRCDELPVVSKSLGHGCLSISRKWMDDSYPNIWYEPIPRYVYWDGYTFIYCEVECRRNGSFGGRWVMNLTAYWVSDETGWHWSIYKARTKRWTVDFGPYSRYSSGEAWGFAERYIALAHSVDYYSAESLSGVSGYNWTIANGDFTPMDPDLHFTPSMDLFRDRRECGDYTLNLSGALAAAYIDAVDKLPTMRGMDNAANAIQLLSAFKSACTVLLGGDKLSSTVNVVNGLKSAWLSYRYIYNTTKADCEELLSIANRIVDLTRTSTVTSNGVYTEGEFTIRCSISITCDALSGLSREMKKRSVSLTAYNMWDMVPFSFIADWFLHVGDWLDTYDKRNMAYRVIPETCWFSVERRWKNEWGNDEIYYYRFWSNRPDLSWVSRTSYGPRVATWVKRGLDVVALFG